MKDKKRPRACVWKGFEEYADVIITVHHRKLSHRRRSENAIHLHRKLVWIFQAPVILSVYLPRRFFLSLSLHFVRSIPCLIFLSRSSTSSPFSPAAGTHRTTSFIWLANVWVFVYQQQAFHNNFERTDEKCEHMATDKVSSSILAQLCRSECVCVYIARLNTFQCQKIQ